MIETHGWTSFDDLRTQKPRSRVAIDARSIAAIIEAKIGEQTVCIVHLKSNATIICSVPYNELAHSVGVEIRNYPA